MLVLDFVRRHAKLTGTKEGCREGDCGACVVLVGELAGARVVYKPVTSCLMPLGEACLLALDTSMPGALEFSGSADAGVNCGVASNSSSMSSIMIKGKADLSADPAVTVGDIEIKGGATLDSSSPPVTHAQPTADPYADIIVPMSAGCDYTDKVASVDQVLFPGTYCGGLTITDSADVFLWPRVLKKSDQNRVLVSAYGRSGHFLFRFGAVPRRFCLIGLFGWSFSA